MITHKPIIWTISGSDCSGGAGIAADIKTAHSLGVEVCHFITANTVQNSKKLIEVNPVSADTLALQFETLFHDKPPTVVKVGLIANSEQVNWLIGAITELKAENPELLVVLDPVGHASVGGKFSSYTREHFLYLLPLIDVITPNALEALRLANIKSQSVEKLAQAIKVLGCNSVIIKGGHILEQINEKSLETSLSAATETDSQDKGFCHDYCLHTLTDNDSSKMSAVESISYQLRSSRIDTTFTHGGGCSFATALAVFLAKGYLVRDAFTLTKAFINQGMAVNHGNSDYYGAFEQTGFPYKAQFFPTVIDSIYQAHKQLSAFPSLELKQDQKLGLYPVIDSLYWLKRLLPLKLNIIQLRIKNLDDAELDKIIAEAAALTKNTETRLFINDYWQLAIKYGAYGVHIGQEDLLDADLQAIQQSGLRLGISTHGCYEFLLAQQLQPSYLAIGAIFPTKTKNMSGQIQGVENLSHILTLAKHIPVVAIGGINLAKAPEVLTTGVDSIAVVTAITEVENPEQAVENFQQLIKKAEFI